MLEGNKETLSSPEGNPEHKNRLVLRKVQNIGASTKYLFNKCSPGAGCLGVLLHPWDFMGSTVPACTLGADSPSSRKCLSLFSASVSSFENEKQQ